MTTQYVYIRSEPGLWTVGFYDPKGKWHPTSDHETEQKAANHVHFLNGGNDQQTITALRDALTTLEDAAESYHQSHARDAKYDCDCSFCEAFRVADTALKLAAEVQS